MTTKPIASSAIDAPRVTLPTESAACAVCKIAENALKSGQELLLCGGCKQRTYCSKECQKQDWKAGHKTECETLKKIAAVLAPPTVRALEGPSTSDTPRGLPAGRQYAMPVLDGRQWQLGNSMQSTKNGVMEWTNSYILLNQTMQNFKESVDILFRSIPISCLGTLDENIKYCKSRFFKIFSKGTWDLLDKKENENEFTHKTVSEQASKISRVVCTKQGYHIFSYCVKKPMTLTADLEKIWFNNLHAIQIKTAAS